MYFLVINDTLSKDELSFFLFLDLILIIHYFRYVVDSADHEKFEQAKKELHDLIAKPQLANIPLLVLGNKNDLEGAASLEDLIQELGLNSIQGREVCCYSISAKDNVNIDITLDWLIKHSNNTNES